jgi:hypothetical protein
LSNNLVTVHFVLAQVIMASAKLLLALLALGVAAQCCAAGEAVFDI